METINFFGPNDAENDRNVNNRSPNDGEVASDSELELEVAKLLSGLLNRMDQQGNLQKINLRILCDSFIHYFPRELKNKGNATEMKFTLSDGEEVFLVEMGFESTGKFVQKIELKKI